MTVTTPSSTVRPRADLALSAKEVKARVAAILKPQDAKSAKAQEEVRNLGRSVGEAREAARDARKTQAHQRVIQLRDQYQLIRKLHAHNPQEMARQLARIFKELKSALKDYAAATKDGPSGASPLAGAAPPPPAEAAGKAAEVGKVEDKANEPDRAMLKEGAEAYLKSNTAEIMLERVRRHEEAQGTLAFLDEVRGLVKEIRRTFFEAKLKATVERGEHSEAFKDADKALKELEEDMADMEIDARGDLLPPTGRADATA